LTLYKKQYTKGNTISQYFFWHYAESFYTKNKHNKDHMLTRNMANQLLTPRKNKLQLNLPDFNLIANQVADVLREAIISGKFRLGGKLIEEELSSMLHVSRTPIRQALHILKLEGLVDLVPRRGAFVSELNANDAEERYQIMGMIESFAVEQMILSGNINLSSLENAISYMAEQIEKRNLKGIIQANFDFHRTIVEMAENKILVTLYHAARNPTRIFQSIGLFSHEDWVESLEDHTKIVEAIRSRDKDSATQLCRGHNSKRCQRIISHLSKTSPKGS
jgi:DNA-binding GntR family transcriptional regulator